MSTVYPGAIDAFTNPTPVSDTNTVSHAGQHQNHNDSITALETKVGITGSAVTTTLDYKTAEITGGDRGVGKTATQVMTNKTLSTATKILLGSDAIGDTYYNGGSGTLTRLAIGSTGQVLTVAGGIPIWNSLTANNSSYIADTGAANAYIANLSPTLSAYAAGVLVQFKATNANTTVSTVNVNGLGVKTIKKLGGVTDLASGDIAAGMIVELEYDGTNFLMLNPVANAPLSPTGDGSGLTNLPFPIAVTTTTSFETAARFTASVGGTGANAYGAVGNSQTTGNSSFASITWNIHQGSGLIYLGNPSFSTRVYVNTQSATTGSSFWGLGNPTVATSGHTYTIGHVGFKCLRTGGTTSLYATQADGTTESVSSALTTVVVGDVLDLYFRYTTGTSTAYYWRKNGGSLSSVTTISTNLPAGTSSTAQFSCSTDSTAGNCDFALLSSSYIR